MNVYQLDFFKTAEESRVDALEKSFERVRDSCDKVRKGQFAKIGELNKKITDLEQRLAILEKYICYEGNPIT